MKKHLNLLDFHFLFNSAPSSDEMAQGQFVIILSEESRTPQFSPRGSLGRGYELKVKVAP